MNRLRPRYWTIRVRLTALYGGMFFLAGALLLGLTYVLVRQSLQASDGPADAGFLSAALRGPDRPGVVDHSALQGVRDQLLEQQEQFRADTLSSLLGYGGLALALVGLAAVGFGWLMAERVLRPLHRITETAQRIGRAGRAERGLAERIALSGPADEIKELADTFDTMLERLDRSFEGQRRFVANASHELRTPLTINRALLEVAVTRAGASPDVRQLGDTLLAVNARHERLIDGLLTLALSDNEIEHRTRVDLAQVVEYVAGQADDEAAAAGIRLTVEVTATPVDGDPVLLERLVGNLVQNGIRHNREQGGWVRVDTCCSPGRAELVVTNTGPAVPGYELESIFEPFRRLGGQRLASNGDGAGVGLGLAIVRAVAVAHGGQVRAEPRDGGGLVVRVTLPTG